MNSLQVFGTTLVFGRTQGEVRKFKITKNKKNYISKSSVLWLVYLFPIFDVSIISKRWKTNIIFGQEMKWLYFLFSNFPILEFKLNIKRRNDTQTTSPPCFLREYHSLSLTDINYLWTGHLSFFNCKSKPVFVDQRLVGWCPNNVIIRGLIVNQNVSMLQCSLAT